MLKSLQIENYAIIRSLNVSFGNGFTVITGETGAGKSILLGALSLLLGNRAESDVLFDKHRKCIVEGVFDIHNLNLQGFFNQSDLDYQDETSVRREINENGKSRAFINDTPVNLNTLKIFSSFLIDIHSQHKTLMLQNADFRIALLDQYSKNQDVITKYKTNLHDWEVKKRSYAELKSKCDEAAARQDYNNFLINELESAELKEDEQEELELKIRELSNAESIKSHLFNALNVISEQENYNIIHSLNEISNELRDIAGLGPDFEGFNDRIESLKAEAQDLSYDISRKSDQIEINPELLDSLTQRLDMLYTLQNKYHVENNAGLLELLEKYRNEASGFEDDREALDKTAKELSIAQKALEESAQRLTEARRDAIPRFAKAVEERLQMLGMNNSSFDVRLDKRDSFRENGVDDVTFLFSGNKGVELSDLAKTASGGELSRIMLCLKSIITDTVLLPTVIFDEIDNGISGETASKVAKVMYQLSENHQVISITHLPQIAAMGDRHLFVYKEQSDDTTSTKMQQLDYSGRVKVIATMLSGNSNSDAAIRTAKEMLDLNPNNNQIIS